MVHQWVTKGTKGSIDNTWRPGRGSMMRPTINEESDCLRKKNLPRRLRTSVISCCIIYLLYCVVRLEFSLIYWRGDSGPLLRISI
jgi:hypothetical protein